MRYLRSTLWALALALLTACTSPSPTPAQLSQADYGEKPSEEEVMAGIRRWMSDPTYGLENPGSLQIRNMQLHRTYIRTREGILFGYLACFEWDAKKRRGGYGGFKSAGYMIRDGEAWGFDHDTNKSTAATFRCSELRDNPLPN